MLVVANSAPSNGSLVKRTFGGPLGQKIGEKMKVFISYAWTNQKYVSFILSIAERLMADGIETIIDKWNLNAGQDKYVFMEQMVQDTSINHVLLMLNKEYKIKSDERRGGVGTEAQIISSDLYNKVDQTKFIPIVTEKSDSGEPYLPNYLKNRIYIDLSVEEYFEEQYEELIRQIYQRPQYSKPKVGVPPAWLFQEKENFSDSNFKERALVSSIIKNDKSKYAKLKEYLSAINEILNKSHITEIYNGQLDFGKIALDKFNEMTPIRDSLINVLRTIAIYDTKALFDEYFKFYRNIEKYYKPEMKNGGASWVQGQFDNYALFFFELIISSVAILIKNNAFELTNLFLSRVLIKEKSNNWMYGHIETDLETIYDKFENIYVIGNYYKSISGKNYFQPIVEILKNRIYHDLTLSDLIEADLIIHYYAACRENHKQHFPKFALYLGECSFDFLSNLIYRDKYSMVLTVLGTTNLDELKEQLNSQNFPYERAYIGDYDKIPRLTTLVDEKIWGTK